MCASAEMPTRALTNNSSSPMKPKNAGGVERREIAVVPLTDSATGKIPMVTDWA